MAFTGNEDHSITLAKASEWTANYRATINDGEVIGEYFSKAYLTKILAQENCVGLRIYYSLDGAGDKHLIICGVKANEDDLENGDLAENALKSPPCTGIANSLKS